MNRLALYLLSMVFCLSALATRAAQPSDSVWHTMGGEVVSGRLCGVYGSLAFVTSSTKASFVPLNTMTNSELERVADFLAARQSAKSSWSDSTAFVTKSVRGVLEKMDGKVLKNFSPTGPEPQIYLAYFSAGWCAPCHAFTPKLIAAYQEWERIAPGRVEVIFVSSDENFRAQQQYAREAGMPWLALDFQEIGHTRALDQWARDGIPCLVALTSNSEAIFHTYQGDDYLGPDSVVEKCQALFAQMDDAAAVKRSRLHLAIVQRIRAAAGGNLPAEPYIIGLDARHYQSVEVDQVVATIGVDVDGTVFNTSVLPALPAVLSAQLDRDLGESLFLPAIEDGHPVARSIRLPIRLRAPHSS